MTLPPMKDHGLQEAGYPVVLANPAACKCQFSLLKQGEKPLPVLVVLENGLSLVPTVHQVINRAGILDAQLAQHGQRVAIPTKSVQ